MSRTFRQKFHSVAVNFGWKLFRRLTRPESEGKEGGWWMEEAGSKKRQPSFQQRGWGRSRHIDKKFPRLCRGVRECLERRRDERKLKRKRSNDTVVFVAQIRRFFSSPFFFSCSSTVLRRWCARCSFDFVRRYERAVPKVVARIPSGQASRTARAALGATGWKKGDSTSRED